MMIKTIRIVLFTSYRCVSFTSAFFFLHNGVCAVCAVCTAYTVHCRLCRFKSVYAPYDAYKL